MYTRYIHNEMLVACCLQYLFVFFDVEASALALREYIGGAARGGGTRSNIRNRQTIDRRGLRRVGVLGKQFQKLSFSVFCCFCRCCPAGCVMRVCVFFFSVKGVGSCAGVCWG